MPAWGPDGAGVNGQLDILSGHISSYYTVQDRCRGRALSVGACRRPGNKQGADHRWVCPLTGPVLRYLRAVGSWALRSNAGFGADWKIDKFPSVPPAGCGAAYSPAEVDPEFTPRVIRQWLGGVGAGTLYIEPGSP